MKREEILARAKDIVSGDRDKTYGIPENSFNRIAQLWQAYLKYPIDSNDVAMMMVLFKIARLQAKPDHEDSWVDIAGYAACGGEIATREVREAEALHESTQVRDGEW